MHGYAASNNTQQPLQNSTTIISNTRVWVFIGHPLPDALDLASCVLGKLKVHIQILLSTASLSCKGRHKTSKQEQPFGKLVVLGVSQHAW